MPTILDIGQNSSQKKKKKKIYLNKFTNRKKHDLILFWMQPEIHDYRYYSDLHTDKTKEPML